MGLIKFLKEKFSKKKGEETYVKGLAKSRAAFSDRLAALSKRHGSLDADYFEELESILIEADVGVSLTLRLVDSLLDKSKENPKMTPAEANDELIDMMFVGYVEKGGSVVNEIEFEKGVPTVLLMEGVNGVGKTTTIAKLCHNKYKTEVTYDYRTNTRTYYFYCHVRTHNHGQDRAAYRRSFMRRADDNTRFRAYNAQFVRHNRHP